MQLPKLNRGEYTGVVRVYCFDSWQSDGRTGQWHIALQVKEPRWIKQADGSTIKQDHVRETNYKDGFEFQEAALKVANRITKFLNKEY